MPIALSVDPITGNTPSEVQNQAGVTYFADYSTANDEQLPLTGTKARYVRLMSTVPGNLFCVHEIEVYKRSK